MTFSWLKPLAAALTLWAALTLPAHAGRCAYSFLFDPDSASELAFAWEAEGSAPDCFGLNMTLFEENKARLVASRLLHAPACSGLRYRYVYPDLDGSPVVETGNLFDKDKETGCALVRDFLKSDASDTALATQFVALTTDLAFLSNPMWFRDYVGLKEALDTPDAASTKGEKIIKLYLDANPLELTPAETDLIGAIKLRKALNHGSAAERKEAVTEWMRAALNGLYDIELYASTSQRHEVYMEGFPNSSLRFLDSAPEQEKLKALLGDKPALTTTLEALCAQGPVGSYDRRWVQDFGSKRRALGPVPDNKVLPEVAWARACLRTKRHFGLSL